MRISPDDKRLLATLHLQADRPVKEIAQLLSRPEHQVRYALQRMESEGIVRRHPFIDVYPLGFTQFEVYTSLASQQQKTVEKFLQVLLRSPLVPWIGQFAGEYQFAFTVCLRNPLEIRSVFDGYEKTFDDLLFRKSVGIRVSYTEFALKCLAEKIPCPQSLSFGGKVGNETIDDLDHRLLRRMSREPGLSLSALSEKLNTPLSTLHTRLRRLREKGIYLGDCCVIDFARLGLSSFKLLISAKQAGPLLRQKISRFALRHTSVQYFVDCIGNWDFEMGALFERPEEINELVQELYQEFSADILGVQTLSAFAYPKVLRYPFDSFPL